tara:strand:+ start:648 stop:785 length:138 start_codon:yes stop_codon:yes gene_type:complete
MLDDFEATVEGAVVVEELPVVELPSIVEVVVVVDVTTGDNVEVPN